ncbi:M20/M25/M40 family metallo-hydrolase [Patescibacteria group bacterium]|nr:M20/M25/M40 family metallo-hydrolase [Patescibacteria group bacterium]
MKTYSIPEKYIELLTTFVSFKSVSTDSNYDDESISTAQWLKKLFLENGFDIVFDQGSTTHPLIIARYIQNKDFKTIAVYGHYDVQPAQKTDGWTNDPFELTDNGNSFIARGVADNKGQILVHMYTVFKLIKENKLGYNVTFVIEGNEESGNKDIQYQLQKYREILQTDCLIISDGETVKERATMESSFRGGGNIRIGIKTARNNLHSGIYGGAVPNAALILSNILSTLKDKENNILVPEFYDGAQQPSKEDITKNTSMITEQEAMDLAGVGTLLLEPELDFYTQTGLRPTLEVTGMHSGYTGEGFQNIIPGYAEARINIRTVGNQNTQKIVDRVKKHIIANIPHYVEYNFFEKQPSNPVILKNDSEISRYIQSLLKNVYGSDVVFKNVGGGIPVISHFMNELETEVISISLANEDCNMHGVDENFKHTMLEKALAFSYKFFIK